MYPAALASQRRARQHVQVQQSFGRVMLNSLASFLPHRLLLLWQMALEQLPDGTSHLAAHAPRVNAEFAYVLRLGKERQEHGGAGIPDEVGIEIYLRVEWCGLWVARWLS